MIKRVRRVSVRQEGSSRAEYWRMKETERKVVRKKKKQEMVHKIRKLQTGMKDGRKRAKKP